MQKLWTLKFSYKWYKNNKFLSLWQTPEMQNPEFAEPRIGVLQISGVYVRVPNFLYKFFCNLFCKHFIHFSHHFFVRVRFYVIAGMTAKIQDGGFRPQKQVWKLLFLKHKCWGEDRDVLGILPSWGGKGIKNIPNQPIPHHLPSPPQNFTHIIIF